MDGIYRQRIHLVWASVFQCVVSLVGTIVLVTTVESSTLNITAGILFMVALIATVLNVTLLLTAADTRPRLLTVGRALAWVALAGIASGGALACVQCIRTILT